MDRTILTGFLDRNRLQLLGGAITSPVSLDLPTTILANLEAVDQNTLNNLLKTWIVRLKAAPASIILILAEAVYFAREISGDSPEKLDEEAQNFAETVPFEETLVKRYIINNRTIVAVANKQLIDALRIALGDSGITLVSVVPEVILGPFGQNHWLDAPMGKYVKDHEDTLLPESFVEFEKTKAAAANVPQKVAGVNRLWVLVAIFIVLITVLIILILPH